MSLSDLGKVCLFSGISGVIELNGKPAAHVRLVRRADTKTDETTTDENGYFEFPPIFRRTVAKYLPQEFVVTQTIAAHHEGVKYDLWSGVKRQPEENAESRGKPLVVKCELNLSERNYVMVEGSPIFSLCTWDVIPDPKEDIF